MTIRIIVIDPFRLCVTERHIEADDEGLLGSEINTIIGGYLEIACQIPIPNDTSDVCFVNEDGIRLFPHSNLFALNGWGADLYRGCGVIVGANGEGATIPARVSIDEVLRRVVWAIPVERVIPPANDDTKG